MNGRLKTAFTLIELLVVIAIVGILSGLMIVGMSSSVQSATIAKAQVFSASLRDSLLMSLISDWKLDQVGVPGASQTPDSWSGGNTCTLTGSGGSQNLPQLQTTGCIYGNCLNFDGTDDLVNCGNGSNLNITNTITFEAWLYPKSENAGYAGHPISKFSGTTDANIVLYYFGATSGMNRMLQYYATRNGTWGTISAGYYVTLNNWYQVVLAYNSATGGRLYINGVATGPLTGSGSLSSNNYSLTLGEGFNGAMDQVRIFNADIPASQIKEQYYAGISLLLAKEEISEEEFANRIREL